MNYKKQNFKNGQALKAEHLNKMEDGIATAITHWTDDDGTVHKLPVKYLPDAIVFTATDRQTATCNKSFDECLYCYQNNILNAVFDGTPGKLPITQYQYDSVNNYLMFYVLTVGGNYQISYNSKGVTLSEF